MNKILLYFIILAHFLVVCFVLFVPFFGNNYLLLLHSIIVPFIMLHWLVNDNTCVLSTLEHKLREKMSNGAKIDKNECFTARLINPIYDFKENNKDYSILIYILTIGLWLTSIGKLYYRYCTGKISSLEDFFKI